MRPAPSLATYSREDSDDRVFRNCLVHLGALGPVASVRLRLVPDYSMQVYAFRGKCLPYLLEHYRELAESCHSFTLGLNFATGECTTWIRHKLQSPLASESQNAGVPQPPADSAMLGTALAHAVPFHELGPDVPGGACHKRPSSSSLLRLRLRLPVSHPLRSENYQNCSMARCANLVHGQVLFCSISCRMFWNLEDVALLLFSPCLIFMYI